MTHETGAHQVRLDRTTARDSGSPRERAGRFTGQRGEPETASETRSGFPRTWPYRRFNWVDAAIMGVGAGFAFAGAFVLSPPEEPRWEGGILFDDALRDAFRAETRKGRDSARRIGDIFYISGAIAPTVIDAALVTWIAHGAPDVAAQMLLLNAQAYSVAGALLIGSEFLFARARPSAVECEADPQYEAYCGDFDKNASFISGHTGIVATSAGLICAHHQYLGLYGEHWADAAACAVGIGAALTTGAARLVNDRHYASDLLAALAIGALSGYALPVFSFYQHRQPAGQLTMNLFPVARKHELGLQIQGIF